MTTTPKLGYLIIKTPIEEDDIYTIKDALQEENDDNIISIEEQGNKLIITISYEEIEEIAQIASTITYTCISLEIYSISIKYCGKESNTRTNTNIKGTYNSLSTNNSRSTAFDSYLRSSLTI
jgi:negative regulator of genetic competence, sporulation and motility